MVPYVLFSGDPDNQGNFLTQARHDVAAGEITAPFFMVGRFLARDSMFGMLTAFGNQGDPDKGLIALTLQGAMVRLFEWWWPAPGGWKPLADLEGIVKPDQWQHVYFSVTDPATRDLVVDGVRASPLTVTGAPFPIPETNGAGLALTFGSYKTITVGQRNIEFHSFNGGLRDWALILGPPPTDAEIARHRGDADHPPESAAAIWGARVWDAWSFTRDPALGPEPGLKGHALTYIDGGTAVGHHLPTLVTT